MGARHAAFPSGQIAYPPSPPRTRPHSEAGGAFPVCGHTAAERAVDFDNYQRRRLAGGGGVFFSVGHRLADMENAPRARSPMLSLEKALEQLLSSVETTGTEILELGQA